MNGKTKVVMLVAGIVAFFAIEYVALATTLYGMSIGSVMMILGGIGLFLFPPFVAGEVIGGYVND